MIQSKDEGMAFVEEVKRHLPSHLMEQTQIELGQCQRFCPEGRVTISAGSDPTGIDKRLGASVSGTKESVIALVKSAVQKINT